jgi:hypothetical protein
MESLAQLEILCERLYNSQDSAERSHAESTLQCFSVNAEYISQCQYILDNTSSPYAQMLASSSLLKQVTDHTLSLQLRLDISQISPLFLLHVLSFLLPFLHSLGFLVTALRIAIACILLVKITFLFSPKRFYAISELPCSFDTSLKL